MSLAADVYYHLTLAGLAPPVPFSAADDNWREAILAGVGEADDMLADVQKVSADLVAAEEEVAQLETENDALSEDVINLSRDVARLEAQVTNLTKQLESKESA